MDTVVLPIDELDPTELELVWLSNRTIQPVLGYLDGIDILVESLYEWEGKTYQNAIFVRKEDFERADAKTIEYLNDLKKRPPDWFTLLDPRDSNRY